MQFAKSLPEEQTNSDPALSYQGEDEAFFPLTKDGAKKLDLAKRGRGSLKSENNSIQIKPYGDIYGGVDIQLNPDVLKGIDKDWNQKVEELAWLVAQRTKEAREVADRAEDHAQEAKAEAKEALDVAKSIPSGPKGEKGGKGWLVAN